MRGKYLKNTGLEKNVQILSPSNFTITSNWNKMNIIFMKLTSHQHNVVPAGFIVLHNKTIKMAFFPVQRKVGS